MIEFDPRKVKYEELLDVFFQNCSGVSAGKKAQYKNAIWVHNDDQREKATAAAKARNKLGLEILDPQPWVDAEDYHQKYYLGHGGR
mmetsp:Transcript_46271/g.122781  ORF Transcript_46271/g.122781 Transcript_46271/m.122781 type:complete len:86 (-) Transcript_46271:225-482(-)